MTTRRIGGVALLAAGLLVACESWQISGLVVQREAAVGTEEGISKAVASITCPAAADGGKPVVFATATTSKIGFFQMQQDRASGPAEDCSVSVEAKGFVGRTYPIDRVCSHYKDGAPDPFANEDGGGAPLGELTVPASSAATAKANRICSQGFLLAEMEAVPSVADAGTLPDAGTEPDAG